MKMKTVINAVKYETWCRVLTLLMRLVVGGLFIFSGFTKAVDPWGGYYKVGDYLTAMGMEHLSGTALLLAVALAALEFMLGVAIAVGAYRRSAPVLGLVLMAVLTPVTVWIAVTGAVGDCGCFGDALHLSGWATVGKNVLLILGLVWLLLFNKTLRGVYGPAVQWMVMAVAYYGYFTQPLIDYRPYPVGTRLVATDGADASQEASEDDFILVYSKDGQEREFTIDSLPDEEDGWEYVTRYHAKRPRGKVIVQDGSHHNSIAIMDSDGDDVTLDVLGGSHRTLLLLFPDLSDVGVASSFALNELTDAALVSDVQVIGLTPAGNNEIDRWKDISMADYPIYNMDDSELKSLARGNPAVTYIEDGVIKWKRTLASLDDVEQPVELSALGDDYDEDAILTRLMLAYLAALGVILVLNRSHLVIKHFFFKKKPKQ